MKVQFNLTPEEILMPVTQHIITNSATGKFYRQSVSFAEQSLLKWLNNNNYSELAFSLSVFVAFIIRMTGSKDVSLILDQGDLNKKLPFKISIDPSLTTSGLVKEIQDSLSEVEEYRRNNVILPPDMQRISMEENKVTFTFFGGNDRAGSNPSIGCRDLGFCCFIEEDKISFDFICDSNAFSKESVNLWSENIGKIIHSFIAGESKLSDIDILNDQESGLYKAWNSTTAPYDRNYCIHDKLIAQAKVTPDKTALIFESEKMSYGELDRNSNAFASFLKKNGVQTGDRIAVCLNRGFGLMVSIYGILKAGAVYMPVSAKFPVSRIEEILIDSSPKFVVTSKATNSNLPEGASTVDIDLFMANKNEHDYSSVERKVSPNEVAYIIYTSGTTGKPKGVMIEHHSVLNRIGWMQKTYPLTSDDVLIQKTPVTFDVSVWELFWWSFVGATLVLLEPEGEKSPEVMLKTIKNHGVTVIHFVPSMFSTFIAYLNNSPDSGQISSLQTVFCSGEALTTTVVYDFYSYCAKVGCSAKVVNLYGPTEATVDVSYYDCPREPVNSIPIGKPIDNTGLYVVNEGFRLQPLNMPGELLICGVNLARGYYNNEPLTKDKFIEFDLFGVKTRAYRTGDITYWSDNGNIYYIGRVDNQIKLRGMRIELGEIESKILLCPEVKYCVVLLINPGTEQSYLAAFYQTIQGSKAIGSKGLIEFLNNHLPDYKIPSVFKEINEIPLTTNGKVDRKVLLTSLMEKPQNDVASVSNSIEKRIFEIWKRILKKDNFNLMSNFFEIGGNSLLLVQLAILMKKEFNADINAMTIMQNPTIKSLAKYLSKK